MTKEELKAKISTMSQDQLMEALRQALDEDEGVVERSVNRAIHRYPRG